METGKRMAVGAGKGVGAGVVERTAVGGCRKLRTRL
jgi:hypothetical protein